MGLLEILRWIVCCGEDEQVSYHSIRSSRPTPTNYSHCFNNNYDLERSLSKPSSTYFLPSSKLKPSSSSSTSSLPSSNLKPSLPSHTSSKPLVSNCTDNSSLSPSPFLLSSSKPWPSLSKPSSNTCPPQLPIPSSNASTQNPFFPPSKPSTSSNPSPSLLSFSKPSLSSSKPSISSSPSPSILPSSQPSLSSSKSTSSNVSTTHFSVPSSNASATQNSSLPSSKLSTSLNPFASNASQPRFSLHSSKFHSASPTQHDKNQCKDLEELIKEAIVSSVSSRPESPLNASPRDNFRSSSKLADQRYEIPKHLAEQIEQDITPGVLRRPLSPSTYSDYFATLLYAEDFYIEKWSKFLLSDVTLELQRRKPSETISQGNQRNEKNLKDMKPFVAFQIDKIPERLPFLLSRDFVFARRSSKTAEPFKGIFFRVVKSRTVLVEFGDDFHAQHSSSNKYDVSFSFNRVCLKRSHQAISAAKDSSLHDILFPNLNSTSSAIHLYKNYDHCQRSMSNRIINHKGPLPYLIEGPLSTTSDKLSRTGTVIQEAILKIYETNPQCRVLICSPTNFTCDELMRGLLEQIPKEKLFRANAAFREYDLVPVDIIRQSLYKEECFACPSQFMLQAFNVITSTYVSSFRLHTAGLNVDHFTHIFLVDASSTMEPEVVVPLANFVGKSSVIVVTGSLTNSPRWVRSDIARRYGLKRSYFQRLVEGEPYASRNPAFITHVE